MLVTFSELIGNGRAGGKRWSRRYRRNWTNSQGKNGSSSVKACSVHEFRCRACRVQSPLIFGNSTSLISRDSWTVLSTCQSRECSAVKHLPRVNWVIKWIENTRRLLRFSLLQMFHKVLIQIHGTIFTHNIFLHGTTITRNNIFLSRKCSCGKNLLTPCTACYL